MARWITVRKPFDYQWPGRGAITAFSEQHLGEHFVKDEIADFAIEKGYATEGKVDEAARSPKGTGLVCPRAARRMPLLPKPPTLDQSHQWVTRTLLTLIGPLIGRAWIATPANDDDGKAAAEPAPPPGHSLNPPG
jgi:hypothetical protein